MIFFIKNDANISSLDLQNDQLVAMAAAVGVVVRETGRNCHVHEHVRLDGDLADGVVHDEHRRLDQKNTELYRAQWDDLV